MDGTKVQYLKDFVAGNECMPDELRSNFENVRDLHTRFEQLEEKAAATLEAHLVEAAAAAQRRRPGLAGANIEARPRDDRFDKEWQQMSQLCDDKVKAAHRIYDFVDARIQELDAQLRGFDTELAAEHTRLGIEQGVRFADAFAAAGGDALVWGGRGRGRGRGRGVGRPASGASSLLKIQKTEGPVLLPSPVVSTALAPVTADGMPATLMPVDPNEPTYCYCKLVSFGEMIACENEECAIEWFHLQCVGIDPNNKPEGDWFCKECSGLLRKDVKL